MKKTIINQSHSIQDTLAVFHIDRDCRIVGLNKNAESLTMHSLADLFGKSMNEIIIFKEEAASLTKLFEQTGWGKSLSRQTLLLNAEQNGTPVDVFATIMPLWGQDRAISGALVTLDTNSQSYYHQLLLDSVSEGVLTVNCDLEITSFNRSAEQITGWAIEDILGINYKDVFPPEFCENQCLLRYSIEQEKSFIAHTVFMTHKDGRFFPLSLTLSPLYDLNGKVIGGVQTFHDCSDSLNNALILASIADGVFTIDHKRIITSFNRAAESITGWKQEEVIGKPCRDRIPSFAFNENGAVDVGAVVVNRHL